MKKKIILSIILLTLIISGIVVYHILTRDFIYTRLEDGTWELSEYRGDGGGVHIPDKVWGKPVTRIGSSAFQGYIELSVAGGENVKVIESGAFNTCTLSKDFPFSDMLSSDYDPNVSEKWNAWSEEGIHAIGDDSINVAQLAEEIGYLESSTNYEEYITRCADGGVDCNEVAVCLNVMLYGNDFDKDGRIDCYTKIHQMDPDVVSRALYELSLAGIAIHISEL